MNESQYTNGTAAFVNLTKHEEYQGQSTGKFSIVLALEPEAAEDLESQGIKLRDYQGVPQRKFASQFPIRVVDVDGETMAASELTYGSKVRVKWNLGKPHPQHGSSPYATAVKVLELNELMAPDSEF
jgi:hypothetical protein